MVDFRRFRTCWSIIFFTTVTHCVQKKKEDMQPAVTLHTAAKRATNKNAPEWGETVEPPRAPSGAAPAGVSVLGVLPSPSGQPNAAEDHRRLERRNKALKAADRMTRRDVIHDAHSESLLNRANRIEGDAAGHRSGGGGGGGGGGGAHPISPQGAALARPFGLTSDKRLLFFVVIAR